MSFRSSVDGDEAGIDARGSKLEAGPPKCIEESSSIEFRKTSFVTSTDNNIRASSLINGGCDDPKGCPKRRRPVWDSLLNGSRFTVHSNSFKEGGKNGN